MTGSLPLEIHPAGAVEGVLAIHGYTGRTADLRFLAEQLAGAGLAVSAPRLPGAGTDLNDLAAVGRRDWRRRCLDSWLDLRSRYERVSLVGYSMGGLLALDLATRVQPAGLVLIAPALRTRNHLLSLTRFAAPFADLLPEIRTGWIPKETADEETREHNRRYRMRRELRSAAEFDRLRTSVVRRLGRVTAAVSVVVSADDPVVPADVVDLLSRRLSAGLAETLIVDGCRHDLPQGSVRDTVAGFVLSCLNTRSQSDARPCR